MCRKPEVRWACALLPRLTVVRGKEGVDARGMEESGKRGLLVLIQAEKQTADCVGGSRVRRVSGG